VPRELKPGWFWWLFGTSELVPFPVALDTGHF